MDEEQRAAADEDDTDQFAAVSRSPKNAAPKTVPRKVSTENKTRKKSSSCPAFWRREQICLMVGDEGIDHFIQRFAAHDLVELVESQMDPVVGESPLRKIVSADSFGAIA